MYTSKKVDSIVSGIRMYTHVYMYTSKKVDSIVSGIRMYIHVYMYTSKKGGFHGFWNPQIILKISQKDCLRMRKQSKLHWLHS